MDPYARDAVWWCRRCGCVLHPVDVRPMSTALTRTEARAEYGADLVVCVCATCYAAALDAGVHLDGRRRQTYAVGRP